MIPMRAKLGLALALTLTCAPVVAAADPPADPARAEILAFNKAFDDATRHMDNAALLAQWADDGISLLPDTAPIIGKAAVGKFLGDVMSSLKGAKMKQFDDDCHDIEVSGPWASEWCVEHQLVDLGAGKPPFEGWGKLLLVLHKGNDGKWRIEREMWNAAVKPATRP